MGLWQAVLPRALGCATPTSVPTSGQTGLFQTDRVFQTDSSHHSAPAAAAFPLPLSQPSPPAHRCPLWEVAWPVSTHQCPPGAFRCHSGSSLQDVPHCQSAKGDTFDTRDTRGRWPLSGSASTPLPAMAPSLLAGAQTPHKAMQEPTVTQSSCMGPDHNTCFLCSL